MENPPPVPPSPPRPCLLVTGGAGFIGANFVLALAGSARVVTLDALTYAGNLDNLAALEGHPDHLFVKGDIGDGALVRRLLDQHRPEAIVNFAAESHVDRSIDGPADFVRTNLIGTFTLLEAATAHVAALPREEAARFRFLQISTDEVYGSLGPEGLFSEESRFAPNSPYAASKAGADHLVRAYHRTYGLPTLTTHSSNNYGPFQHPEKLVPLMILSAVEGKPLPIYGDGRHVRDWLHVDDHVEALCAVLARGVPGETYDIGGGAERSTLAVVEAICAALDELAPGPRYREQIVHVEDRPGHDRRYAIDAGKMRREIGWAPRRSFEEGIRETARWYLDHRGWCARAPSERLGLGAGRMPRG
jgi:dTDP-glucose 4,6-dehydratase